MFKGIKMTKKKYCKWEGNTLILELCVQPRASRDAIVGVHGDRLKVTITSAPTDGKANKHLIKFLAKYFGVTQKQVQIKRGESSRFKSVVVIEPVIFSSKEELLHE